MVVVVVVVDTSSCIEHDSNCTGMETMDAAEGHAYYGTDTKECCNAMEVV